MAPHSRRGRAWAISIASVCAVALGTPPGDGFDVASAPGARFDLGVVLAATAPPLAAEFVSQSVPTSMIAGQSYQVSVTMRNSGSTAWTAATAFRLGSQNPTSNQSFSLGRIYMDGAASVGNGEQYTFTWTATAPSASGTYNFQWRMVQEAVAWFGEKSPNTVVTVSEAAGPPLAAQFVSQSVPTSMIAGQAYPVSVTMRNTGSTPWTAAAAFRLGAQNPTSNQNFSIGRVYMDGAASVGYGQEYTFLWIATAPSAPGTYNFQWRMLREGVAWFGDMTANTVVAISGTSPLAAEFVSQSVPMSMIAGQAYPVSVTMRNTGSTPWTAAAAFRLGAQNPTSNQNFSTGRIYMDGAASVGNGEEYTFSWTATAPAAPGTYNFQWRMVREAVAWFGDKSSNRVVTVNVPVNASSYVGQTVPTVMVAGRRYAVSVRLRNSGTTTWDVGAYRLESQNPPGNTTWGVASVDLDDPASPGQEVSLAWTVTAPAVAGHYDFQWGMQEVGVESFAAVSANAGIDVVAARPTSSHSLRFRGNGAAAPGLDRVAIRIDDPATNALGPPVDVGASDFTIELWMKAAAAENTAGAVTCGANINWIFGNVLVDRDRYNQDRKFGLSLADGRPVFGVSGDGTGDRTICGSTQVLDDQWHHIAVQRRRGDGHLWLYVDGALEADADGPDGDVSYPDDGIPCANCCGGSSCNGSDPFLVLGAEKHDAGAAFPSYGGLLDEVRISRSLRYTGTSFAVPSAPFAVDGNTAALYHFDEGNGEDIVDDTETWGGPSPGTRRYGGDPAGPDWSTDTPFPLVPAATVELVQAGVGQTVALAHAGDHRLFLVDRTGVIRIYDGTQVLPVPFLNIDPAVGSGSGEQGLLGLAFHPQYEENGSFFVDYTDNAGDTVIARYRRSVSDPDRADAASGVVLLSIDQPFANHNGGQLQFGPDGYLYVSSGDGGSGGDPSCNAQRGETLLGKILRLDVDQNVDVPPYHGIPPDNPFAGPGDPLDEIWSMGLRNPWRFSFDRLTRAMFIGDVGQGTNEEIDYQHPESAGGDNYGWKIMEGLSCFSTAACPAGVPSCNDASLILPILQYGHVQGNCSVTGGYVSRSPAAPALFGSYVYADYCSGRIWAGRQDDGAWASQPLVTTGNIATFGEDSGGNVYLGVNTAVYRLK